MVHLLRNGLLLFGVVLLALGIFVWLAGAGSASAQDHSPLEKRLFAEGPQAWEAEENFWLTLEGTASGVRRIQSQGKETDNARLRMSWKQCNGNMLNQSETFQSGSWNGSINGENSEYTFVLGRSSEERPWVIKEVNKKTVKSLDAWNGRKTLVPDLIFAPVTHTLPQVFRSRGFKCVNVAPEPTTGEELVRLTFTFSPEGKNRLTGGWLVLDPSHYWVIRRGEVDADLGDKKKGTAKWTVQHDYKEGSNHHPIITRKVLKGKGWEDGRLIFESDFSIDAYDLHERATIPESEFRLSAYGLPEPLWAQPKKTHWYFWLGLAGILCLMLGATVAWLKKRRVARLV
jgi:hypothetical protein